MFGYPNFGHVFGRNELPRVPGRACVVACVGVLISLDEHRRTRCAGGRGAPAVEVAFDLSSAWTYLAAERVDQLFPSVRWKPVVLPVASPVDRAVVELRARQLRMPLIWPEYPDSSWRGAMRVAAFAAERECARAFVLACGRLAYCGGFNLDDPEILAEAAAAACLPFEACLRAAGDRERDHDMLADGYTLLADGVDELPAVRVGDLVFCGEERLGEAAAAARSPVAASLHPSAS